MSLITLYTTAICPYCIAARRFLAQRGLEFREIRVDTEPQRRVEMRERSRRHTVPQIFVGEQHVGGFDDMIALDRQGGFMPMLEGT